MNPYIKNDGGNLVRVFEAIDGYRRKYREFPKEIILGEIGFYYFVTENLTQSGWEQINKYLSIKYIKNEVCVIAKGDKRKVFDYGKEGWKEADCNMESARSILGFENK